MSKEFHDFYVPISGTAIKFSMRCDDGKPKWIGPMVQLAVECGDHRARRVHAQLDLLNHLLKDLPWAALASCCGRGPMGAVIEAAEARRAEIYGKEIAA